MSDIKLTNALNLTYDRIRTDGLVDFNPGQAGGKKLANRFQDSRFIVFKDADSWLKYQNKFGAGDIYNTMTQHLDRMARDTALLEILGPNPDAMIRYISDVTKKAASTAGKKIPNGKIRELENIYKLQTGRTNQAVSENAAAYLAGARNILTSAQLGGAFLSAVTDLGYQKIARGFNGLPQVKVFSDMLGLMNPLNQADRDLAVQLGLVAESATSMALAQRRYLGETMGPKITQLFADVTLRASLLTPWTQAGKHAFGLEMLGFMARSSKKEFNDLSEPLRRSMQNYGIEQADWDKIRNSPMIKDKSGASFVSPVEMAEIKGMEETANKLHQMVLTETDFAVPSVDSRARSLLLQGTQPGTLNGEIMRSVAMYKSFPVSVIMTHIMRGLNRPSASNKAVYLSDLIITTTLLGAVAYQAKQIQRGKDPINMDPETEEGRKFWAASLVQGGGLGIFGDFLFADVNRFGKSPSMTFAGPMASFADDIARYTIGNVRELAQGEDTGMAQETVDMIGRYMPGGSLWYARLAFERTVLDQLKMKTDRNARKSFRRTESFYRKNFKQKYWWKKGNIKPSRPPQLP